MIDNDLFKQLLFRRAKNQRLKIRENLRAIIDFRLLLKH